jgi:hypothetical protein
MIDEAQVMTGNALAAKAAVVLIVASSLSLPAWAQPLSIDLEPSNADKRIVSDIRWDVFLEGDIEAGDADRLERELVPIGNDKADVYLNSPGGSLMDGLRIGRLLRRLGVNTFLGKRETGKSEVGPGVCLSACSIAFLGGVRRSVVVGSIYGVHRVSMNVHSERDFDAGQIVAAEVSRYLRDMGVDSRLFDRMASTDKDSIYVLGSAELRALHIVDDGKQPARWNSRSTARGPSLEGTQQTPAGTEKASLVCDNGTIEFHSAYFAGSNAAVIASGQWVHSLLIDDTALPLDAPSSIGAADGYLNATFNLSLDQERRISGATSIGHSMHGDRSDPEFLGYTIDIDAGAAMAVRSFLETCSGSR